MSDPCDPLGRLAEHAAHPYDHPPVSEKTMLAYWRGVYAAEAALMREELDRECAAAADAVASCEAAWTEAERRPTGSYIARGWEAEQQFRQNAIERANLRHRLVRLRGRRDALAAEAAQRRSAPQTRPDGTGARKNRRKGSDANGEAAALLGDPGASGEG